MNRSVFEKVIKGCLLASVVALAVYLITKDIGTAGLMALVMFLSMFARSKEEKVQGAIKHTAEYKQVQNKQMNKKNQPVQSDRFKNRNKSRNK